MNIIEYSFISGILNLTVILQTFIMHLLCARAVAERLVIMNHVYVHNLNAGNNQNEIHIHVTGI